MGVAWRGAVEFAGFPVNMALHSRVRKARTENFKTIAPSGEPMASGDPIDTGTGKPYPKEKSRKGVKRPDGTYATLDAADLEKIKEGQKTKVAEPAFFAPLDTIALDLAIDRFAVRPDDKVAGAEKSTNIIWNGLRSTGLAYVTQVALRDSGMDGVLVLHADDNGFWATLLPFEDELYEVPTHTFTTNEKEAELFDRFVGSEYKKCPFDHSAFESQYKARRTAVIEAVLAGTPVDETELPKAPEAEAPDLMALMEQALGETVSA